MKSKRNKYFAVAAVSASLLAACGGSGDDGAGQLSPFQVSPDNMEITSGNAACDALKAGDFLIIGGTAPYTVFSPYHQQVTFGPAGASAPTHQGTFTIPNRNNQFSVFFMGGWCFDPAVVTVLDDLKRVATIEVAYKASGAN